MKQRKRTGIDTHKTMLTWKGETMSAYDWAVKLGIPQKRMYRRLVKYGTTDVGKLLTTEDLHTRMYFEIDGSRLTLKELSGKYGISHKTISSRIARYGCSDVKRLITSFRQNTKELITVNGITDSVSGWSNRTGIDIETIRQRINKLGWSPEEAVGAVAHQNGLEHRITINGETHTLVGWARSLGISVGGFQGRYRRYLKGRLSTDRLLQKGHISNPTPAYNIIRYKWNGKMMTIPELSRIAGMDKSTFHEWLKRGWSIEKIMTTPKKKNGIVQTYMVNGSEITVKEASMRFGLKEGTIRGRIKTGMDTEIALTHPVMSHEENQRKGIDARMKNKRRREMAALGIVV